MRWARDDGNTDEAKRHLTSRRGARRLASATDVRSGHVPGESPCRGGRIRRRRRVSRAMPCAWQMGHGLLDAWTEGSARRPESALSPDSLAPLSDISRLHPIPPLYGADVRRNPAFAPGGQAGVKQIGPTEVQLAMNVKTLVTAAVLFASPAF